MSTIYEREVERVRTRILTVLLISIGGFIWASLILVLGFRSHITHLAISAIANSSAITPVTPPPAQFVSVYLIFPIAYIFVVSLLISYPTRAILKGREVVFMTGLLLFVAQIFYPIVTNGYRDYFGFESNGLFLIVMFAVLLPLQAMLTGLAILTEPHYRAFTINSSLSDVQKKVFGDRVIRNLLAIGNGKKKGEFMVYPSLEKWMNQTYILLRPLGDYSTEVRVVYYTRGRYSVYKSPVDDLFFDNRVDFLSKMITQKIKQDLTPLPEEEDHERGQSIQYALEPTESRLVRLFRVPTVALLTGLALIAIVLAVGLSVTYPSVFTPEIIVTVVSTVVIFVALQIISALGTNREVL